MRKIFVVLMLLASAHVLAQNKTFTGYYINQNGDTIRGNFTGYTQWSRNPSKVRFQPIQSNSFLELAIDNCKRFLIEGHDEYVAYTGKRLLNPIEDHQIMDNEVFWNAGDRDTLVAGFLRVIFKSTAFELFCLNDATRTNFFYQLNGGAIQELKFKKYLSENRIIEVEEYKQQIKNLFLEEITRKKLSKAFDNLGYQEESFKDFFGDLLMDDSYKRPTTNQGQGWMVSGGIAISSLNVANDSYARWTSFENSVSPFVSIGHIFPFNRDFGRFFLYPQLRMYRFSNTNTSTTDYYVRKTIFKADLVILPELNIGAHLLNKQKIRVFLSGGLGMMGFVNGRQVYKNESPAGASAGNYELKLSKIAGTANVTAGMRLNRKISVSATYYIPTSLKNFTEYTPRHSSFQAGLSYQLK